MTFDNQGNPMNVTCPDPEQINHNQIFPRYKLGKKVNPDADETVNLSAIKGLKIANARRIKISSHQLAKEDGSKVGQTRNTANLTQSDIMYENKLHTMLSNMQKRSNLAALLTLGDQDYNKNV